jgi:hypothetical protein
VWRFAWCPTLRGGTQAEGVENRTLRGMGVFGSKQEEVKGGCCKLLHYLYLSPVIIRLNESRRITWALHVACTGGEGSGFVGET